MVVPINEEKKEAVKTNKDNNSTNFNFLKYEKLNIQFKNSYNYFF